MDQTCGSEVWKRMFFLADFFFCSKTVYIRARILPSWEKIKCLTTLSISFFDPPSYRTIFSIRGSHASQAGGVRSGDYFVSYILLYRMRGGGQSKFWFCIDFALHGWRGCAEVWVWRRRGGCRASRKFYMDRLSTRKLCGRWCAKIYVWYLHWKWCRSWYAWFNILHAGVLHIKKSYFSLNCVYVQPMGKLPSSKNMFFRLFTLTLWGIALRSNNFFRIPTWILHFLCTIVYASI